MIEITKGNLIEADAEALVNTVNCKGFMGKGIALQFKKAFPDNFKAYEQACRAQQVRPGQMFVFQTNLMMKPRYIINFPTKRDWRGKSKIEDIQSGLNALVAEVNKNQIRTIAVPPLGCGLGGLDWNQVRSLIEAAFADVPDVRVLIFEPSGPPAAKDMPIRTERPKLTVARALFIRLMKEYMMQGYRLTLLEIQKLAYFLQEAGQPLRLKFDAGHYGPYAPNLNKVLEIMDGHFISGYGDSQKPDVEINLLAGASEQAEAFLKGNETEHGRLERVNALIGGFKTPYGMELLSSVHWLANHGEPRAVMAEDAVTGMAMWTSRKQKMFLPGHIRVAWDRLAQEGWLEANTGTNP